MCSRRKTQRWSYWKPAATSPNKRPSCKYWMQRQMPRSISLDLTSDSVKVFSSTERKLNGANDLVGLIANFFGRE